MSEARAGDRGEASALKLGIYTGPQHVDWPTLRDLWLYADGAGFHSAWLRDHLMPLRGELDGDHLEPWTLIASLAAITKNVQIGHLVTANTLRHPALLAKMAATVDHVANGRLVVGIGTGYFVPEHERYGIPLPEKAIRAEMLDESCTILKSMWGPGRTSFAGKHYTITDAPASPKPVNGDIPLLLGGAGERLLRNAAAHADLWNMPDGKAGIWPERFREKLETLHRNCEAIGRDPGEIETTMMFHIICDEDPKVVKQRRDAMKEARGFDERLTDTHTLAGTPDQIVEQLQAWEKHGLQHLMVALTNGLNYELVPLLAERVLPHVR